MTAADLIAALEDFKRAAAKLDRVWTSGDFDGTEMGDTYPDFLPDFSEAAFAIADMQVEEACPVCHTSDRGCDDNECRSM